MGHHEREKANNSTHLASPKQDARATAKDVKPEPASTRRAAAVASVDFGDIVTDETAFENVYVFNQYPDLAFLSVHIEGSDSFRVASSPSHLNPSANGFDPTAAIRVAYSSRTRKVDRASLIATLQWRDATTETVRIGLRGAAHKSKEGSHAEEQAQIAEDTAREREAREREVKAKEEEARISREEAKGGSDDRRITNAAGKLTAELENLFEMQKLGVERASHDVAKYQRRKPVPPPPSVVEQLAWLALDLAAGKVASLLKAGINATSAGWSKGTPAEEGWGYTVPAKPGTKAAGIAPVGAVLSFVVGKVTEKSVKHAKQSADTTAEHQDTSGQNEADKQFDYFEMQSERVAHKQRDTQLNTLDLKRSLIHLDNPRDAGKAAAALVAAAGAVRAQQEAARSIQAAESTKGWIHCVSHSSLGSVSAQDTRDHGRKALADGTATAKIDNAVASKPYDGVIELEFDADPINAGGHVKVTSASLLGVSNVAAASLQLDKKTLRSAGLPIRARSSAASSPMSVSIARDEAGNVQFRDDSGAAGMPTPWLSRRGGKAGSESAAQNAAKKLIDDFAGKTLRQLNVSLKTDSTDE